MSTQTLPQELIRFFNLSRLAVTDSQLYFSGEALLATDERKELLLSDLTLVAQEIERLKQLLLNK